MSRYDLLRQAKRDAVRGFGKAQTYLDELSYLKNSIYVGMSSIQRIRGYLGTIIQVLTKFILKHPQSITLAHFYLFQL